jgi:hypothetical protein
MVGWAVLVPGRQLSRAKLTDGRPPARIAVLPLPNERWVSAFAIAGGEWDDVPGQHASANDAVAAAVREIERVLAAKAERSPRAGAPVARGLA